MWIYEDQQAPSFFDTLKNDLVGIGACVTLTYLNRQQSLRLVPIRLQWNLPQSYRLGMTARRLQA